jgi:hypothetical protein
MMYGAALRTGKLSPVMPGWTLPTPQLYAVFLSRQGMVPAVRAFVDYLVEVLGRSDAHSECPLQDDVMAVVAANAAVRTVNADDARTVVGNPAGKKSGVEVV